MSETIKENYDVKDSKIDLKKHEDNYSLTIKENYDVKDSKIDLKKHEDNYSWRHARPTKESFREICRVLNEPRPYRSSDSIKQYFLPDFAKTY